MTVLRVPPIRPVAAEVSKYRTTSVVTAQEDQAVQGGRARERLPTAGRR